jgi:hypothetical protein
MRNAYLYLETGTEKRVDIADDMLVDVQAFEALGHRNMLTLIGEKRLYVYEAAGMKRVAAVPRRPVRIPYVVQISILSGKDGGGTRYGLTYEPEEDPYAVHYFDMFDESGAPLAATAVDPRTTVLGRYLDSADLYRLVPGLTGQAFNGGMKAAFGMAVVTGAAYAVQHPRRDWAEVMREAWWKGVAAVNAAAAIGLIGFARLYRLRRRTGLGWGAVAAVLGPMAAVMFAGSHAWPVRREPTRGRLRGVEIMGSLAADDH